MNFETRGNDYFYLSLVEFSDRDGMEYALRELDDTKLDGRRIRLVRERRSSSRSRSRDRKRDERGSNRSRSKSRSRSRSYRRSQERSKRNRSNTPDDDASRSPSAEKEESSERQRYCRGSQINDCLILKIQTHPQLHYRASGFTCK